MLNGRFSNGKKKSFERKGKRTSIKKLKSISRDDDTELVSDEQALAALNDGARSTVQTMFLGRAESDMIAMEHVFDIVRELKLPFDPDGVAKHVHDSEAGVLSIEQCLVLIGRLTISAREMREERREAAVEVQQTVAPIVYLPTLAFVQQKLPWVKDDGVDYRWQRPEFEVRPRVILMLCVSLLLFVATIALTGLVIALAERVLEEETNAELGAMGAFAQHAGDSLVTGARRVSLRVFLNDSTRMLSKATDVVREARRQLLGATLGGVAVVANASLSASLSRADDTMASQVRVLQRAFESRGSLRVLNVTLDRIRTRLGAGFFVLATDQPSGGTFRSPGACPLTSFGASACLAAAAGVATGNLTMGTGSECGAAAGLVSWAAGRLPTLGVSLCVVSVLDAPTILAHLPTAFNSESARGPASSLSLEVSSSAGELFGGRNRPPSYCSAPPLCPNTNDLERVAAATAIGSVNITHLQGKAAAQWFGAVTRLRPDIILGATVAVSDILLSLYGRVSSAISPPSAAAPSLIVASATTYGDALPLPSRTGAVTVSAAVSDALNRARQSQSDVSIPVSTSEGMVAFAPTGNNPVLAVASEMSVAQQTMWSLQTIGNTVRAAVRGLPSDWDMLVYQRSTFTGAIELVSEPRVGCGSVPCRIHAAAEKAFANGGSGLATGPGVHGDETLAAFHYFPGPTPVVVVVERSAAAWEARRTLFRAVTYGLAAAIFVASLAGCLLFTQQVLNRIENDYNRYKAHIEDEKQQFGDLVRDVMPPLVAQQIMRGTRLIAEMHPQLTFFFSDIVGSTETSKLLNNKQLVRMLGYTFMLEDAIASHFNIHKIKTIGDAYFAVSGLEDAASGAAAGKDHQVYRMVAFACITQQLFGPEYAHFPERTECFKVSAAGEDLGPMRMVRLRMGIHTGPAVAGVVDVGRAPHFDCFGPSVNLASRMESTSTAGRVQISGPTEEILTRLDREGLFEFEAPRKTLIKGYGTMVTYLIKSTNIKVPSSILDRLFIERASRRTVFQGNGMPLSIASPNAASPNTKGTNQRPSQPTNGSDLKSSDKSGSDHPRSSAGVISGGHRTPQDGSVASYGTKGRPSAPPAGLVQSPERHPHQPYDPFGLQKGVNGGGNASAAPTGASGDTGFVYGHFDMSLPPPPPDF